MPSEAKPVLSCPVVATAAVGVFPVPRPLSPIHPHKLVALTHSRTRAHAPHALYTFTSARPRTYTTHYTRPPGRAQARQTILKGKHTPEERALGKTCFPSVCPPFHSVFRLPPGACHPHQSPGRPIHPGWISNRRGSVLSHCRWFSSSESRRAPSCNLTDARVSSILCRIQLVLHNPLPYLSYTLLLSFPPLILHLVHLLGDVPFW